MPEDLSSVRAPDRAWAGFWRVVAEDRLRWLRCEYSRLPTDARGCANHALNEAAAALHARRSVWRHPLQRIAAWWSGWDIESTWRALHDAEAWILANRADLSGGLPALKVWIRRYLAADDLRVRALDFDGRQPTPEQRSALELAIRAAFIISDNKFDILRGQRNKLFVAAVTLAVLTLVLGLQVARHPEMLPLCATGESVVCPTGNGAGKSTGGDIWFVYLLGAIGAAIAAVQSLLTLRQSAAPYTLSGYLAMVKILLGAVFAAVGLLFLTAGLVGNAISMDNRGTLLAAAVVLGYSQQVGTRMLDTYAKRIMVEARPGAGGPSAQWE